jgi:membrane protease subunit HflK
MYLETMEKVLGNVNKVILDGEAGQGVVPYLPLDQLRNTGTGGTNARSNATGGTN